MHKPEILQTPIHFVSEMTEPDKIEALADENEIDHNKDINVDDIQEFQDALFKCLTCKAVFKTEGSWSSHQKLAHDNVLPDFICDLCQKGFNNANDVNRHVREVHQKRAYVCQLCGTRFSRKYNCKDHLKKKHSTSDQSLILDEGAPETEQEQELVEQQEPMDVAQEEVVVTEKATDEGHLKCDKCDFKFNSAYFMHQHFEQVHGISVTVKNSGHSDVTCQTCQAPFKSQVKHLYLWTDFQFLFRARCPKSA